MIILIGIVFVMTVGSYFTINSQSVGQLQGRSNVLKNGFCTFCGDQLEIDSQFCSNCGIKIKNAIIN
jgi:predicted amidophosphoribosyltransferase